MDRFKVDNYDITGKHEFLITDRGGLSEDAKRIPTVRSYFDELAETSSTFTLSEIQSLEHGRIDTNIIEFAGTWKVLDMYVDSGERYVNPNAIHADQYPYAAVSCECGSDVALGYDTESSGKEFLNEHEHTDTCKPHQRLQARADISQIRYDVIRRLSWMGWRGSDIAPCLGVSRRSASGYARDLNTTFEDLYALYKASAGKTYHYFVEIEGEDPDLISDIYGHSKSYLGRLSRKHVDDGHQPDLPAGIGHTVPSSP